MRPLLAILACFQQTITPGDHSLRVDRVHLGTDTIVVLIKKPHADEQLLTTLVRRVERDGDLLRLVQRYESPDGEWEYDTVEVSALTLALRRSVEIGATTTRTLQFDGTRLTGTFASEGVAPKPIDEKPGPFFPEATTEIFIPAYPLDVGRVTFPEMSTANLAVSLASLTVDNMSPIVTADGWVDCYVVHGFGQETLWVARGDGRLLRERWVERDGTVMWKLPRRDVPFRRESYVSVK